ncbi:MAG: IS3 family transposase [Silvanigrellaceae bacterium]|nr:IS3 family transposase [Silvanigrellaceae bacterium]
MAIKHRKPPHGCIFHSDKGSQYTSHCVVNFLKRHRFHQSMSGKGNCYDHALTETFFATLKKELVYLCDFNTRKEARSAIFEFIEVFYNKFRLHSKLDF